MNYYNYFTEIEEHFVRRRGKHMFVSPMDWSLIATWRDTGIPLHVALRGIDLAMDSFVDGRGRGGSKVSSLFYCHDSVMSEYQRHLEAHLGEQERENAPEEKERPAGTEDEEQKKSLQEFLAARISEINEARAKHTLIEESAEGIERVLARIAGIESDLRDGRPDFEALDRDLGILDEDLVEALSASVPEKEREAWEKEAKGELKIYRKRLPKETYEKIFTNFMRSKVRTRFGIRELSLFDM